MTYRQGGQKLYYLLIGFVAALVFFLWAYWLD
jgi:hypothetical protein